MDHSSVADAKTGQPHTLVASYQAFAQLFWGSHTAALPVAPVGLLALAAVPLFCRRHGRWAIYAVLVATVYVLTVVGEGVIIGDSFQGRYLVWLIPFGAVPLLFLVTEYPPARRVFVGLATIAGLFTAAVLIQVPETVSQAGNGPVVAWSRFADLRPTVTQGGYSDVTAVLAWSIGLVVAATAIYVSATHHRSAAAHSRPVAPATTPRTD